MELGRGDIDVDSRRRRRALQPAPPFERDRDRPRPVARAEIEDVQRVRANHAVGGDTVVALKRFYRSGDPRSVD